MLMIVIAVAVVAGALHFLVRSFGYALFYFILQEGKFMKRVVSLLMVLVVLLCGCSVANEDAPSDAITADDGSYEYDVESGGDIPGTPIDPETLVPDKEEPEEETPIVEDTEEEPEAEAEEPVSATVYRTRTGKKYHREGCQHLKSKIETTVDEARAMGLKPCKVCSPPQ